MSSPGPKVSIIVNNFNYDRYLAAAIDSALGQTYPNCEVIVVDDGSTDGSREILRNYQGRLTIVLQENGGQAAAFNAGFERSSGDLVHFLDSDDVLHSNAIAEVARHWQEGFTKIQFPLEIIDFVGRPTGLTMPSNRLSEGNVVSSLLTIGRYVTSPTSGNVYARSLLSQVMPIPTERWSQGPDSYLDTNAGFAGNIGVIRTCLGSYRVHGQSMSASAYNKGIDISQIQKLIGHGERQQDLINTIADSRQLLVKRNGLASHWLQLKLTLTFQKLALGGGACKGVPMLKTVWTFLYSVARDSDVPLIKKSQLTLWAVAVGGLPRRLAEPVIRQAFDLAPNSTFSRLSRRVGKRNQLPIARFRREEA